MLDNGVTYGSWPYIYKAWIGVLNIVCGYYCEERVFLRNWKGKLELKCLVRASDLLNINTLGKLHRWAVVRAVETVHANLKLILFDYSVILEAKPDVSIERSGFTRVFV